MTLRSLLPACLVYARRALARLPRRRPPVAGPCGRCLWADGKPASLRGKQRAGIRPYEGFAGRISRDLVTLEAMTYLDGYSVAGVAVGYDGSVFIADGADSAVTGYLARFDAGLTERPACLSYYPGSTSGSSRTYFNTVKIVGEDDLDGLAEIAIAEPVSAWIFRACCGAVESACWWVMVISSLSVLSPTRRAEVVRQFKSSRLRCGGRRALIHSHSFAMLSSASGSRPETEIE